MDSVSNVTLIKFGADWCGPCQAMKPEMEKVLKEVDGINFIDINVDQDPDKAVEYQIRSIPALILEKDGKIVRTLFGSVSAERIREFLSD